MVAVGDVVAVRVFDDGNGEFEDLPNQYEVVDTMSGKVKLMNIATKTVIPSISAWKVGKQQTQTRGSAMGGPYAEITKKELRKFLKDRGIRGVASIEEGIKALEVWDASHTWQDKEPWRSFLASLGRNPRIEYGANVLRLESELYTLGYDFSEAGEDDDRASDVIGRLAELYDKNKNRDFKRPSGTMAYMDRPTMGRHSMGTMGKPTMGSMGRQSMGTMGRPTMGTYGKGTCGTMAIAGQASKLLAKAKAGYKGAKSAVGDQYWKGVSEKVGDNLKSQHTNFIEEHKAHAKEWAAALDNLTKDLKAALAALQKAEGLDNDDPKKEKKVKAAEDKRDKVLAKMDKWLDSHDDQPREKIGQMFEPFQLGGVKADKKLDKLDKAVHKAIDDLEGKYGPATAKAVKEAQEIIADAVKAAVAQGWKAGSLSNRTAYGI
jgi:hypothetical protein